MIKVALLGATGRMGLELIGLIKDSVDLELSGASCGNSENYGQLIEGTEVRYSDSSTALQKAQVAIDFSIPSVIESHLQQCVDAGMPYVCGVTGLDAQIMSAIDAAAHRIAIFWAPNMSIGVSVCVDSAGNIARQLKRDFEVNIFDLHHAGKKDAPSGTALEFARVIDAVSDNVEIEFESVREGQNPGKHKIKFIKNSQVIELHHQAGSRAEFAQGALQAAILISKKLPGRYNMQNLLENNSRA